MPKTAKAPNPNAGIRKKNKETVVKIPLMSQQEIAIPSFFATPVYNKQTGNVVGYSLVNPLTKARNLSKRRGEPSIKLIRKPVENMILMSHSTTPIPLEMFSKKDREVIDQHFKVVESNKDKELEEIPNTAPFVNKERGRPEKLPKNIAVNKERKVTKKKEPKPKKKEEEKEEGSEPENTVEKSRKKPVKHQTDEERLTAIRESKRLYAQR